MKALRELILISFLVTVASKAFGARLQDNIKVTNLYLELNRTILSNRDYHLVNIDSKRYELNLGLNTNIGTRFYWNNLITSKTDSSQFRFIGLDSEFGYRLLEDVKVYYRHFSGHALDSQYDERFPEDNSLGIRLDFISE